MDAKKKKKILNSLQEAASLDDVKVVLSENLGGVSGGEASEIIEALANEVHALHQQVRNQNRAREVLFASVAHDLRNPLNTFAMSAGLLRDDLESESSSEEFDRKRALSLLSRMDRASARMQATIEDLLEASRIEASALELTFKEVDAPSIVKAAIETARPTVTEKGASIEEEDGDTALDDSVRFITDKNRVIEVLTKLVHVALKAIGERGIIRVGARTSDVDEDEIAFTVRASTKTSTTTSATPPTSTTSEDHRGGLAFLIARGLTSKLGGRIETDGLRTLVVLKKHRSA